MTEPIDSRADPRVLAAQAAAVVLAGRQEHLERLSEELKVRPTELTRRRMTFVGSLTLVLAAWPVAAAAIVPFWLAHGGEVHTVSALLAPLARFEFCRWQPFGIVDDLWHSWRLGMVLPAFDELPSLWWVDPATVHALAPYVGAFAVWCLAVWLRRWLCETPRRAWSWLTLSAWIAWACLSPQFFLAGGTLALWVGFVLLLLFVGKAGA